MTTGANFRQLSEFNPNIDDEGGQMNATGADAVQLAELNPGTDEPERPKWP